MRKIVEFNMIIYFMIISLGIQLEYARWLAGPGWLYIMLMGDESVGLLWATYTNNKKNFILIELIILFSV